MISGTKAIGLSTLSLVAILLTVGYGQNRGLHEQGYFIGHWSAEMGHRLVVSAYVDAEGRASIVPVEASSSLYNTRQDHLQVALANGALEGNLLQLHGVNFLGHPGSLSLQRYGGDIEIPASADVAYLSRFTRGY